MKKPQSQHSNSTKKNFETTLRLRRMEKVHAFNVNAKNKVDTSTSMMKNLWKVFLKRANDHFLHFDAAALLCFMYNVFIIMWMKFIIYCSVLRCALQWCLWTSFAGVSRVNSVDFSPDGEVIVMGEQSGRVTILNTHTLQILQVYDFNNAVYTVRFSHSGSLLGIGGDDDDVQILNYPTLSINRTLDTNQDKVHDLDFKYDDSQIFTCGEDLYGRVWSLTTYAQLFSLYVYHQAYSCKYADNNLLMISDNNGDTYTYTETGNKFWRHPPQDIAYDSDFRPGGQYFIAVNTNHQAYEGYSYSDTVTATFTDSTDELYTTAYSRDASYFLTAGKDAHIYLYNSTNRNNTLESILYDGSQSSFISSRFSDDSNYFLVGNSDGTVYMYNRFCPGCPVGSYPNQTSCRLCMESIVGCAICVNSTHCLGCTGGYYLNGVLCTSCETVLSGCATCNSSTNCTQCLQGYYLNGLVCQECENNIQGCSQCDATACFSCSNRYFLDSGTCTRCSVDEICLFCNSSTYCLECLMGYYEDSGTCVQCGGDCLVCQSSSNCTQCVSGMYVVGGTCVRCSDMCQFCGGDGVCWGCVEGWFLQGGICEPCVEPCISCTSAACLSCVSEYYLTGGACIRCVWPCVTCDDVNHCLSCAGGYYLDTGTNLCELCADNCTFCTQTECLQCTPTTYLNNSTCTDCKASITHCIQCTNVTVCEHCEIGYYEDGSGCTTCDNGCSACRNSGECTQCSLGYYLLTGTCTQCADNCVSCLSAIVCEQCGEGYMLSGGDCVDCAIDDCVVCENSTHCSACAPTFYVQASACVSCSSHCLTCDALNCIDCQVGFYIDAGACLRCGVGCGDCYSAGNCSSCVLGYYYDGGLCEECGTGCQVCNITSCEICQNGFYLDNDTCIACNTTLSNCLLCNDDTVCQLCQYSYTPTPTCTLCSTLIPNCQHCMNGIACETCELGFYLGASGCEVCTIGCQLCLDSATCEVCVEGYVLDSGVCHECEGLMRGCNKCDDVAICDGCYEGYYLLGAGCQSCELLTVGCELCDAGGCMVCSPYYYLTYPSCALCSDSIPNCQLCTSSSQCIQCQASYYLSSNTCSACPEGCMVCSSSSVCLTCKAGYHLLTNSCVQCQATYTGCILCDQSVCQVCEGGYYLDSGQCYECDGDGCQVCNVDNPAQCLTCNYGYYLQTNLCHKCSSSMNECQHCSDDTTCTQCTSGYYLDSDICHLCSERFDGCSLCTNSECIDCLTNYFLNATECIPCYEHLNGCAFCEGPSLCVDCVAGYYLHNDTCIRCISITGCIYCDDSVTCTFCQQSYYLSNSSCLRCNSTIANCYACLDENVCVSCEGHFMLDNGQCIEIEGEVISKDQSLKLVSEYVSDTELKHTLHAKGMQYVKNNNIDWNVSVLIFYVDAQYNQTQLNLKKVQWGTNLQKIIIHTSNPLNISQGSQQPMPFVRLLQSSLPLSHQIFKVVIPEAPLHELLPTFDYIGDLYVRYEASSPEMYKSYLAAADEPYVYFWFGTVAMLLLVVLYLGRTCVLVESWDSGSIIPDVMVLKCGALALYPTYVQYVDYCYGYMILEMPWLNEYFWQVLGTQGTTMPQPYTLYYNSLSFSSTYLLPGITALFLYTILSIIMCSCSASSSLHKYFQLLYYVFGFAAIMAGCLCCQTLFINPIYQLTIQEFFYLVGMVVYVGFCMQTIYSIIKLRQINLIIKHQQQQQPKNTSKQLPLTLSLTLIKTRLVIKATLCSLLHLAPLALSMAITSIDCALLVVMYQYVWIEYSFTPKLQLLSHVLANAAFIMLLAVPNAKIGMLIVSFLVVGVVVCEFGKAVSEWNSRNRSTGKIKEASQQTIIHDFKIQDIEDEVEEEVNKPEPVKLKTRENLYKRKQNQIQSETFIFADFD